MTTFLDRARRRGEIGPAPVPAHILPLPTAPLRHDLVLRRHRPSDTELARLVDDIFLHLVQRSAPNGTPSRAR
jgi:hypothetical protein